MKESIQVFIPSSETSSRLPCFFSPFQTFGRSTKVGLLEQIKFEHKKKTTHEYSNGENDIQVCIVIFINAFF